jgi:hypothetical protein
MSEEIIKKLESKGLALVATDKYLWSEKKGEVRYFIIEKGYGDCLEGVIKKIWVLDVFKSLKDLEEWFKYKNTLTASIPVVDNVLIFFKYLFISEDGNLYVVLNGGK